MPPGLPVLPSPAPRPLSSAPSREAARASLPRALPASAPLPQAPRGAAAPLPHRPAAGPGPPAPAASWARGGSVREEEEAVAGLVSAPPGALSLGCFPRRPAKPWPWAELAQLGMPGGPRRTPRFGS